MLQNLALPELQVTPKDSISGRQTGGRRVCGGEAEARQRPRQRQRDGRLRSHFRNKN